MAASSYHDTTQGGLIERLAAERPDGEALVFPARDLRWTWADLERRSLELARGCVALGLEPGDRVVVWSDNRPDWVALQFALGRIGAVLVTANTALEASEIAYLLGQSRARAVVACAGVRGQEYLDALEAYMQDEPRELRHVIALEAEPRPGMLALDDVVRRGRDVAPEDVRARTAATNGDDPTNIQYTSGTTGFPKGVVLTHRNIVENGWAVAAGLGMSAADRLLVQVPLFHCFGCVICVLGAATHAATMVMLQRFDPEEALAVAAAEHCTVIHGVPTMFQAMLATKRHEELDLSSLRTGVMAGSMCPEPLMHRVVEELGCRGMLVAYGLTEASPAVTMSSPDDSVAVRCGTVGRALQGVHVRVVDTSSRAVLPPGAEGELQVRGPNVMQGYFDDEEATREALTDDGWLRTGDLARIDDEGLVRIVGRIKEMIIRGGENVYPAEVEDALRSIPGVADAAVFGVPSEHWGEDVACAIIPDGETPLDAAAIGRGLGGRLAHFKRPTQVHFVTRFPLTGSGKVRRFQLARELAAPESA